MRRQFSHKNSVQIVCRPAAATLFFCDFRAARSGSEEDDDEGLQDFIVDEEGKPIGELSALPGDL
jgi:hypothetical protein